MTTEARPPICDEVRDLIPSYALDTLDPGETFRVKDHVAECTSCAALLDEYRRVADELLVPATIVEPPAGLEDELTARVSLEPGPSDESQPISAPEADPPAADEEAIPVWLAPLVRIGQRLNRPERQWSLAAVSVTLILLVAVLGTNLYWAVVTSALRSDQQKLATLVEGQQAALAVTAAGGRAVELQGGEFSPSATGMLAISADGGRAVLVVAGLPRQQAGMVYQLWLIHGDRRDSGGLFTVDKEGRALMNVESDQAFATYDRVGVTLEPAGGSPGPTSPPALGGPV